jgi:hypothetical protein
MDHVLLNKAVEKYSSLFLEDARKLLKASLKEVNSKKDQGIGVNVNLKTEIDSIENAMRTAVTEAFTKMNASIYEMGITQFSGWRKPEEDD